MKKILLFMSVALLMIACDNKDEPKWKPDPNAMINIRPALTPRATIGGLDNFEIVKEAVNIRLKTTYLDRPLGAPTVATYSFDERQKDFETPMLKMFSDHIINLNGDLVFDFLEAFDVFIVDNKNDTIAYITDETIKKAKIDIEKAFNNKDYDEVYRLFDKAYTFYPMSPKE